MSKTIEAEVTEYVRGSVGYLHDVLEALIERSYSDCAAAPDAAACALLVELAVDALSIALGALTADAAGRVLTCVTAKVKGTSDQHRATLGITGTTAATIAVAKLN